ncbi:LTA synthase family protein [Cognatilysobacter lacus]|uniref:LTA synthase family protein n=1 Tax=Cognatilysobacter lacus TaxID=1643323 RepID=A0A5D8YRV8_9GAMM|nr:LTA synthase family protein [Lysobacter lacus]TZF85110.1 LTA synthase family protein [Lysobacter lacus]
MSKLPPGRYRPLAWLAAVALLVWTSTRLALAATVGSGLPLGYLPRVLGFGLVYDLATLLYLSLPLVLLVTLLPDRAMRSRLGRGIVELTCFGLLLVLGFVAMSEWTFWDEFQSRFNFIAVDYLVYTQEVLGNIRQSYPVGMLLAALGATCLAVFFATRRFRRVDHALPGLSARLGLLAATLALCVITTLGLSGAIKNTTSNHYADELAGNGIYEFFAAYRGATLDYRQFYRTLPDAVARARTRSLLATPDAIFLHPDGIVRRIKAHVPERRLNVVLISVESFSADYSGTFGREESLTPNLDALTPQSLVFSQLYATGTRTVRGLEALSLSVPPTPGESIVKRDNNHGLATLATIFNAHGYTSEFVYGGYGRFDNMNDYFGHNGYQVHDREEIPSAQIHHENIWGVADEDLYTLAMGAMDHASAQGHPFFAHLMTTSNHRPYTFPAGRGPWKQHDRISAVRYTDWAIADFLRRARQHSWFRDTVFVITADHCAMSAGKATLPAFRYRIPMWIYSPAHIKPGVFDGLMSQIDIPPTLLGLLGFDYTSRFYGADVMVRPPQRAYIGTYELLGYIRDGKMLQLGPNRAIETVVPALKDDVPQPLIANDPGLTDDAVALYQTAADDFSAGRMQAAAVR